MKTPTKQCRNCDGHGYLTDGKLPIVTCDTCDGLGEVELTEDEQWNDQQARIDDEAERMNDNIYSKS